LCVGRVVRFVRATNRILFYYFFTSGLPSKWMLLLLLLHLWPFPLGGYQPAST